MQIKVFDETVKDDVLKALNRSELDIEVQMEGKDIKVKLGLGKKEQQDIAIKKIKEISENCKKNIRFAR